MIVTCACGARVRIVIAGSDRFEQYPDVVFHQHCLEVGGQHQDKGEPRQSCECTRMTQKIQAATSRVLIF